MFYPTLSVDFEYLNFFIPKLTYLTLLLASRIGKSHLDVITICESLWVDDTKKTPSARILIIRAI